MSAPVSAARGIDVACGCFSTRPADPGAEPTPMLFSIGRDAALLGLAIFMAWVRLSVAREEKSPEAAGKAQLPADPHRLVVFLAAGNRRPSCRGFATHNVMRTRGQWGCSGTGFLLNIDIPKIF